MPADGLKSSARSIIFSQFFLGAASIVGATPKGHVQSEPARAPVF